MSKSAYLEEDSSWAQTFFTVTPQDDGFLREIEDTVEVSGKADVGLNLDSWNIVFRRPLSDATTKDFIDLRELEKPEFTATECQTYLQGVPKVDLPLAYRDEATQTLYMGKDEKAPFEKAFDNTINVLNEKPLPLWKRSKQVQTKITVTNEASLDEIIKDLETDGSGADHSESEAMISAAAIECADAMNFLVDRALWMAEPVVPSKIQTKEAEVSTTIKFNHASQKLTVEHEVQTDLTCEPRFSDSMMLLKYYNRPRVSLEQSIEPDSEKNVEMQDFDGRSTETHSKRGNNDEVTDFGPPDVEANLEESAHSNVPSPEDFRRDVSLLEQGREETKKQTDDDPVAQYFSDANGIAESRRDERNRRISNGEVEPPAENDSPDSETEQSMYDEFSQRPPYWRVPQKTEEILLTEEASYVSRNLDEAAGNQYLNRACPSRTAFRNRPRANNVSMRSQISHEKSSSSLHSVTGHRTCRNFRERELPAGDEKALQTLKHTFCTQDRKDDVTTSRYSSYCARRISYQ